MYTGFRYATRSGSSIGVNDFVIPDEKAQIIDEAKTKLKKSKAVRFWSGNPG